MPRAAEAAASAHERLAQAARDNFQFLWRTLRRLGVRPDAAVDDAVQEVLEIAVRKREQIEPGRERGYLFKTAIFVAADARRAQRKSRARQGDHPSEPSHAGPSPEQTAGHNQDRLLLDEILEAMPDELRTVFVLFELERASTQEIADLLGLPMGTAASRLRRAREQFRDQARRLQARSNFEGER
jgi:RNA polymerase sigma-70 factor (ECF subfamily)